MRFHQPVARLLLAATALAVALAVAELAVRIVAPQNVAGSWLRDSGSGYDLNRPSTTAIHTFGSRRVTYRLNDLGLRGASINPTSTRVLVLGDSITFGWLLDERDTYVSRLDHALQRQFGGQRVALLNAAVGGWGTGEYVAYLEEHGQRARPDAVLVFFSGAELMRAHRSGLWRVSAGTLERVTTTRSGATRLLRTLSDVSLYRWLSNRSHLIALAKTAVAGAAATPAPARDANGTPERDELHAALVRRMVAWCRERDIPIWFIATGMLRLDDRAADGTPFLAGLGSLAADLAVPYVDLRSRLYPRLAPGADYVIPVDLHPNEAAAVIVAELAQPWLAERVAELLRAPSRAGP